MPHKTTFEDVFGELKGDSTYKSFVKVRICKIILGSSVIRPFVQKTKGDLLTCLIKIKAEKVLSIQTQSFYDRWHYSQVKKVYASLRNRRGNITRIKNNEGLEFGHATKIFNLFIGHLVFYSPYFQIKNLEIIGKYLHVPLDRKVFDALRACGVEDVPTSIKTVTKATYYRLQSEIRSHAASFSVPPLYFDDYAWTFEKGE